MFNTALVIRIPAAVDPSHVQSRCGWLTAGREVLRLEQSRAQIGRARIRCAATWMIGWVRQWERDRRSHRRGGAPARSGARPRCDPPDIIACKRRLLVCPSRQKSRRISAIGNHRGRNHRPRGTIHRHSQEGGRPREPAAPSTTSLGGAVARGAGPVGGSVSPRPRDTDMGRVSAPPAGAIVGLDQWVIRNSLRFHNPASFTRRLLDVRMSSDPVGLMDQPAFRSRFARERLGAARPHIDPQVEDQALVEMAVRQSFGAIRSSARRTPSLPR